MITLTGLTPRQVAFCEILWQLQTRKQITAFIQSLPQEERTECLGLLELLIVSHWDDVQDLTEAQEVIERVRY